MYGGGGGTASEFGRIGGKARSAIYKKAGTCKFLGGCKKAIRSGEFCGDHQPVKPEKSNKCRSCGWVFGIKVKVIEGVCNQCYQKPEAKAAHKQAMAEKKDARGICSTIGYDGINLRGLGKCHDCLLPRKKSK